MKQHLRLLLAALPVFALLMGMFWPAPLQAMRPLQGNVAETHTWQPGWVPSMVLTATGHTVANARVNIDGQPACRTNANGQCRLPLGGLPTAVVAEITQPARPHAPHTVIISPSKVALALQRHQVLEIRLPFAAAATQTRTPLDTQWHRLGDGSYSQWSAGSGLFNQQAAESHQLHYTIICPGPQCPQAVTGKPLTLTIGAIVGLDTVRAHQQDRIATPFTASAFTIHLNGKPLGDITTNGIYQTVSLPGGAFPPGTHTLTLQTGWHWDTHGRQDWDDMALQGIWLE